MRSEHRQVVGRPAGQDVRCPTCRTLLAKLDGGNLSILRGELRALIDGDFRAAIDCYRCKTVTVLAVSSLPSRRPEGSGP